MIPALLLIPVLVAMAMLNGNPPERVTQKVYLPCLMLLPLYLEFKLGGFLVGFTSLVALLLAVVGWQRWSRTVKFTTLDALVFAYALSAFYSDLHAHAINVATYAFLWSFTRWVCPYVIGRTLIEQTGSRTVFSRVIVLCLAAVAVISLYEYRLGYNPFQHAVEFLIHEQLNIGGQYRWGFARITGPYGLSIIAGLTFATGVMFQLWLVGTKSWLQSAPARFLKGRKAPLYMTLIVLMGLFITQSRGPWIGCAFGLIVASIGFSKNRRQAAIYSISTLIVVGTFTTVVLKQYTTADERKTRDRDQLNAEYRANLYETYKPLLDEGGAWGYGTPHLLLNGGIGWSEKQTSIDNEYLRVAMQQGYVGIAIFILLLFFSLVQLIRLCITLRSREDILFAYCMLGVFVSASFTLSTVFLGEPMIQLLFLCMGWAQSVRPSKALEDRTAPVNTQQYQFERVFV